MKKKYFVEYIYPEEGNEFMSHDYEIVLGNDFVKHLEFLNEIVNIIKEKRTDFRKEYILYYTPFDELTAKQFSKYAHDSIGQKRKYTGEPYWTHCERVAELLQQRTDRNRDITNAAWLHDIIEDVVPHNPSILNEMISLFTEETIKLVYELTDISKPEDGNRAIRKAIDRERLSKVSIEAKIIKFSDLIDNCNSIREYDPEFFKIYLEEAKLLHLALFDVNAFSSNNMYRDLWITLGLKLGSND